MTAMQFPLQNVLIVDDDYSVRYTLRLTLKKICPTFEAACTQEALHCIRTRKIDLILLDIMLKDEDGVSLLKEIKQNDPEIEVIMLTAIDDPGTAIKAITIGAYDYITKPFSVEKMQNLIVKVLEKKQLAHENSYLKHELAENKIHNELVIKDPSMINIYKQAEKVARTDTSVLIYGESGCGKEILARFIHQTSNRADAPFVAINCGGLTETLLETELFGHERGSFTDAHATKKGKLELVAGGTLFLDEIGTMPLSMQIKLLRVIQEMTLERVGGTKQIPVNFRIIAATNRDLDVLIKENRFREDLYFRLNVVSFRIPPLRERREDIPVLIDHFNEQNSKKLMCDKIVIHPTVKDFLLRYNWPGNVRELRNVIESFYALYCGSEITFSCLPVEMFVNSQAASSDDESVSLSLKDANEAFEKNYIRKALKRFGHNQTKTAQFLNIHRNTLIQKMQKYNLS